MPAKAAMISGDTIEIDWITSARSYLSTSRASLYFSRASWTVMVLPSALTE